MYIVIVPNMYYLVPKYRFIIPYVLYHTNYT